MWALALRFLTSKESVIPRLVDADFYSRLWRKSKSYSSQVVPDTADRQIQADFYASVIGNPGVTGIDVVIYDLTASLRCRFSSLI